MLAWPDMTTQLSLQWRQFLVSMKINNAGLSKPWRRARLLCCIGADEPYHSLPCWPQSYYGHHDWWNIVATFGVNDWQYNIVVVCFTGKSSLFCIFRTISSTNMHHFPKKICIPTLSSSILSFVMWTAKQSPVLRFPLSLQNGGVGCGACGRLDSYLIFVIFFTQAKF